jgi:hypothetical protein
MSILFSFLFHLPRLIILFLFKKLVRTSILKISIENYVRGKKRAPNDPSPPFKEKEKGGEGRSKAWWPMECSNAWWPMEGEGKTPFHLFPLSPRQILLKPSIFSFDFKVLLYHGCRPLLTHFLSFP